MFFINWLRPWVGAGWLCARGITILIAAIGSLLFKPAPAPACDLYGLRPTVFLGLFHNSSLSADGLVGSSLSPYGGPEATSTC